MSLSYCKQTCSCVAYRGLAVDMSTNSKQKYVAYVKKKNKKSINDYVKTYYFY